MEKISCMKELSLFSNLDYLEREKVGKLAGKKVYYKGDFIFREGDPANTIYLVKYGRVRLFKVSPEGKEITLDILKEDDLLGESTLFEEAVHTMNAQVLEKTFICSCSRSDLQLLLKNSDAALKIIQYLGEKLQNYTEQVADIAFRDVKGRLAASILKLAREYGEGTEKDNIILEIELTHQDLACLVSASRVMVSNVLKHLKEENVIDIEQQRIILLDKDKLAQVAFSEF